MAISKKPPSNKGSLSAKVKEPINRGRDLKTLYTPRKKASAAFAKNEAYMGPLHQQHFQDLLMKQKEQLLAQADRTVDNMRDSTSNYPDVTDRATHEQNFGMELQVRRRELQLMKKIEGALKLIERGAYGYCVKCEQPIGVERLEVRPTAEMCIKCKTTAEEHEHSHPGT
jgi:DnaK suppressor protein